MTSAESSPPVSRSGSSSSLPEAKRPIISQKKWHDRSISWIKENKGTVLKVAIVVAAVIISLAFPSVAIIALPIGAVALATLLISKKDMQKVMKVAKDFFKAAPPKATPYKDAEKNVQYLKEEGDKVLTSSLSVPVQIYKDFERFQGLSITTNEGTTHHLSENKLEEKVTDFFRAIEAFCDGDRTLAINVACLSTQGELSEILLDAFNKHHTVMGNEGKYLVELKDVGKNIQVKIIMKPNIFGEESERQGPFVNEVWCVKTITVDKEQLKNNDFSSAKAEVTYVPRSVNLVPEPEENRNADTVTRAYANNMSEFVDGSKVTVVYHEKRSIEAADSPTNSPRGEVSPLSSPAGSDIKDERAN